MKKENCVVCNAKIDTRNYELRGNYCYVCTNRVNAVCSKFITTEEADEMVKARINEVKQNNENRN